MAKRLAIVTQDPANYGGVLRLVEYVYQRASVVGVEPTLIHYGRFAEHPELSAALTSIVRGEINVSPKSKRYTFHDMNAVAIGATIPEWEPNRIHSNSLWQKELAKYDGCILVTGAAHTGAPLAALHRPFAAWVSATVAADRAERLKSSKTLAALIERLGLISILRSETSVLRTASSVMAVSASASQELKALCEYVPDVWPFPVDTEKFTPSDRATSKNRFVFVGRANDPRKRVDLFIDACERLHNDAPTLKCEGVIVSSVGVKAMPPFVTHVSGLSDEELIDLYCSSSGLVLTSEQEGLGIAAMEAMACGVPVISTRCGGPETFIEDNISGLFVSGDARKIAEAMYMLASRTELRQQMGEAARARIDREFSERVWNHKFEQLILDLTNGIQDD